MNGPVGAPITNLPTSTAMALRVNTNLSISTPSSNHESTPSNVASPLSPGETFVIQSTSPLARIAPPSSPRSRSVPASPHGNKKQKRHNSIALLARAKKEDNQPALISWLEDIVAIDYDEDLFSSDPECMSGDQTESSQSSAQTSAASTAIIEQREFTTLHPSTLTGFPNDIVLRPSAPADPPAIITVTMSPEDDDYNLAEPIHNTNPSPSNYQTPSSVNPALPPIFVGRASLVQVPRSPVIRSPASSQHNQSSSETPKLAPPGLSKRAISPQRGPALAWTFNPADSRVSRGEDELVPNDLQTVDVIAEPASVQPSPSETNSSPQSFASPGSSSHVDSRHSAEQHRSRSDNEWRPPLASRLLSDVHSEKGRAHISQQQQRPPLVQISSTSSGGRPTSTSSRQALERLHIPPPNTVYVPELIPQRDEVPSPVSPIDDDLPLIAPTEVYARSFREGSQSKLLRSEGHLLPRLHLVESATTSATTVSRSSEPGISTRSPSDHMVPTAVPPSYTGSSFDAGNSGTQSQERDMSVPETPASAAARPTDQGLYYSLHHPSSQASIQQLSRTNSMDKRLNRRKLSKRQKSPSVSSLWGRARQHQGTGAEIVDSSQTFQMVPPTMLEGDRNHIRSDHQVPNDGNSPYRNPDYEHESADQVNSLPDYRPAGRFGSQSALHRPSQSRVTEDLSGEQYPPSAQISPPAEPVRVKKSRFGFSRSSQSSTSGRMKTSDEFDQLQQELSSLRARTPAPVKSKKKTDAEHSSSGPTPSVVSTGSRVPERAPSKSFGFGRQGSDQKGSRTKKSNGVKSGYFEATLMFDETRGGMQQVAKAARGGDLQADQRRRRDSLLESSSDARQNSIMHEYDPRDEEAAFLLPDGRENVGRSTPRQGSLPTTDSTSMQQRNPSQTSIGGSSTAIVPDYRDELARSSKARKTSNQTKMEDLARRMSTMGY